MTRTIMPVALPNPGGRDNEPNIVTADMKFLLTCDSDLPALTPHARSRSLAPIDLDGSGGVGCTESVGWA